MERNEFLKCFSLPVLDEWDTVVNASTLTNEVESFAKRYFKETPEPDLKRIDWKLLRQICDELVDKIKSHNVTSIPLEDFLASKKGKLGMRYQKAFNDLKKKGYNPSTSRIGAFIKNERYFEPKPPRFIMGRNPEFNILYAKYVAPFEKAFFKLDEVANACDFESCGKKFAALAANAHSFTENDMSKYESSQRHFMLALEHYVMKQSLKDMEGYDEKEFDTIFAVKCVKKGQTPNGLTFSFLYCRGSGDMDTSCGNGVLNYITSKYFWLLNHCDVGHYDRNCRCQCHMLIKGDDSVLINPTGKTVVDYYKLFGFDAKLLHKRFWWEVEFCSGRYIRNGDSFFYVQSLKKLLTSIQTIINPDFFEHAADYYYSLGKMYSAVYANIPVYCDLGRFLMTCGGRFSKKIENDVTISYGLKEAILSEGVYNIVESQDNMMFDIAMVNGFDLVELNVIRDFLMSETLILPKGICKPIRNKNNKGFIYGTTADFHIKIHESAMTKDQLAIRKYLHNNVVWTSKRGADPCAVKAGT